MTATIRIPTPLRNATNGESTVEVDAATVGAAIESLEQAHPGVSTRLLDDSGKLRRFVNVFVDDEDVRFQQGLETPLKPGSTVSIIPAVAGGC